MKHTSLLCIMILTTQHFHAMEQQNLTRNTTSNDQLLKEVSRLVTVSPQTVAISFDQKYYIKANSDQTTYDICSLDTNDLLWKTEEIPQEGLNHAWINQWILYADNKRTYHEVDLIAKKAIDYTLTFSNLHQKAVDVTALSPSLQYVVKNYFDENDNIDSSIGVFEIINKYNVLSIGNKKVYFPFETFRLDEIAPQNAQFSLNEQFVAYCDKNLSAAAELFIFHLQPTGVLYRMRLAEKNQRFGMYTWSRGNQLLVTIESLEPSINTEIWLINTEARAQSKIAQEACPIYRIRWYDDQYIIYQTDAKTVIIDAMGCLIAQKTSEGTAKLKNYDAVCATANDCTVELYDFDKFFKLLHQ